MRLIHILFTLLALLPETQAAPPFSDVRGLAQPFQPEYRNSLSPVYGAVAIENNILENIRFRGLYGKKVPQLPCPEFAEPTDCPQDATAAVVQRLFPSADRLRLVPNQRPLDLLSTLTPKAIAGVLQQIVKLRKKDRVSSLKDPEPPQKQFKAQFKEAIALQILKEVNTPKISTTFLEPFQQLTESLPKMESELLEMENQRQTYHAESEEFSHLTHQIEELSSALKLTQDKKIPKALAEVKKSKKWKELDAFGDLLWQAVEDSEKPNYPYPTYTVEHSLLGYLWMKTQSKEDLLPYYRNLASYLQPDFQWFSIQSTPQEKEWVHSNFHRSKEVLDQKVIPPLKEQGYGIRRSEIPFELFRATVESEKLQDPSLSFESRLQKDPELSAWLGYLFRTHFRDQTPLPRYGLAAHPSLAPGEKISDCVETSIRSFVLAALQRPNQSANQVLQSLVQEHGNTPSNGFQHFIQEYGAPHVTSSQEARNAWLAQATSGLPGVTYKSPEAAPVCNMMPSQTNILKALTEMLGDEVLRKAPSASEKWDRICKLFSNDAVQWTWRPQEGNREAVDHLEKGLNLIFAKNGDDTFSWKIFETHHASLDYIEGDRHLPHTERMVSVIDQLLQSHDRVIRDPSDLTLLLSHDASKRSHDFEDLGKTFAHSPFLSSLIFQLKSNAAESILPILDLLQDHPTSKYDSLIAQALSQIPVEDQLLRIQAVARLSRWQRKRTEPFSQELKEEYIKAHHLRDPSTQQKHKLGEISQMISKPAYSERDFERIREMSFKFVRDRGSVDPQAAQAMKELLTLASRMYSYPNGVGLLGVAIRAEDTPLEHLLRSPEFQTEPRIKKVVVNGVIVPLNEPNRCVALNFSGDYVPPEFVVIEGQQTGDQFELTTQVPAGLALTFPGKAPDKRLNLHQAFRLHRERAAGPAFSAANLNLEAIKGSIEFTGDFTRCNVDSIFLMKASPVILEGIAVRSSGQVVIRPPDRLAHHSGLSAVVWGQSPLHYEENGVLVSEPIGAISPAGLPTTIFDFERNVFRAILYNPSPDIQFCFN